MNRGEVRTIMRRIMAEPYATGTFTDEMCNGFITSAYIKLANIVRNRNYKYYYSTDTISTVGTVRSYELPDDCVSSNILNIRNAEGYSLIPDDIKNFDINDTSSEPVFYDIADNEVYFDPVPTETKTYTLEYFRVPTELTFDSIPLDFPAGQEEIVAWKAAAMAKKSVLDISEYIEQEYMELYETMLKSVMLNKYISPPKIEVSKGNFGKYWVNRPSNQRY